MPLSGNERTFARIFLKENQENALDIVEETLEKMKLTPKEINDELHLIKGKTKANFLKNTWGAGFCILTKKCENQSVVDIYFNGAGLNGPDTGGMIDKFYDKLCKIISTKPEVEVSVVSMSDEEILKTANENIRQDNTSDGANSVADEIAKLSKLKADGAISDEEFTKMKNELIDKM
jgi:predicted Zn-dependent peptidase